jgi:hypothetical protein
MYWLVKCDIVRCFDKIDHTLLLALLLDRFGKENFDFVELVDGNLPGHGLDREGVNHACTEKGIPEPNLAGSNEFIPTC